MRNIVLAVVIIGISITVNADLTDDQKIKIITEGKACVDETGVDPELVKKARQGIFSDDEKLKKFAFCLSKKVGFQNDAGEFQTEVIRAKLGKAINNSEAANKLIDLCLKKRDTPEETAAQTFKCYHDNTPTHVSVF